MHNIRVSLQQRRSIHLTHGYSPDTMNCIPSNYCMIMIKVIGVFDKVLLLKNTGVFSSESFRNTILDSVYDLNPDQLLCPSCGCAADWNYLSTQTQRFVWEASRAMVYMRLPILIFRCRACGSKGAEMVTTDLTIGKSDLSFHYLFELIRTRGTPDIDLVRKETLLDERMSQYSLNR